MRFSTAGTHLGSFGQFRSLRGVAVSPDGSRVYGVDAARNRITVSTASGGDLAEFGSTGSKLGELRSPSGIATDAAGNVWVVDRGNDRVQEFTADGTPVTAFGERGSRPGQFIEPVGISVDCHGLVTVGDSDNNRVQTFQAATPGACAALPAIQSPPAPILYTQPGPVPPVLNVTADAHREHPRHPAIPAADQLRHAGQAGRHGHAEAALGLQALGQVDASPQSLAAGKTVTVRPRLSAAGAAALKRALGTKSAV